VQLGDKMEILLNTSDIQAASQQLKSKSIEVEAAIQNMETAINPLRSFKSPRIARDLEAWDETKTILLKHLQVLLDSAEEVTRAAIDNEAANS
jgi:hypothetical protein